MSTIFSVEGRHIEILDSTPAAKIFGELLWAEARVTGLNTNNIHITPWENVPDGGIDAFVDPANISSPNGLIKAEKTCYQIKTGTSFKPWLESNIKGELFKNNSSTAKNNLKDGIKRCLDAGGTYVLVCFGHHLTEPHHNSALTHLKKYLSPKIQIIDQHCLSKLLEDYPSLALKVNGNDTGFFQSHKSWGGNQDMKYPYVIGDRQQKEIGSIRQILSEWPKATNLRVRGEAGVGKTKLVYEATNSDDLRPLVVYCGNPREFQTGTLMADILRDDNHFKAIVVIDDCDRDSLATIWNRLSGRTDRIKLITTYNEDDNVDASYIDAPPLADETITEILTSQYNIPKDKARDFARECEGSPRVAHVFGWNLNNNPEDLLKSPSSVNIWDRYIAYKESMTSAEFDIRKRVLSFLSLFRRFGYRPPNEQEAKIIHKRLQDSYSISWQQFEELIDYFKNRKILQGEFILYITPIALQIKLWIDWWNTHGSSFDYDKFTTGFTPSLQSWFNDMFEYGESSPSAKSVVKKLLGTSGPFQKKNFIINQAEANFFLSLAKADPKSAMRCLNNMLAKWSTEELLKFKIGRREVVWALEFIGQDEDLFEDCAKLLLMLGEAENENISNNASGVFADYFSLGWGALSPTKAAPSFRLQVLQGALTSDSPKRRKLALSAFNEALKTTGIVRMIGLTDRGLRKDTNGWSPKTWGEVFDAFIETWRFLENQLEKLDQEDKQEAIKILLDHARSFMINPKMAEVAINSLKQFAKSDFVQKQDILETVVAILHYDKKELPTKHREELEKLNNTLTGTGFSSLLSRYVGMDLLEDKYDDDGNRTNASDEMIKKLAKEALENKSLLKPELIWLVTDAAKNGYKFGYELGKIDTKFELLSQLLKAQKGSKNNTSDFFLGGYLRVLFERQPEKWEVLLDEISNDPTMIQWIIGLTWRSGMSDQAARRVLSLAKTGKVEPWQFSMFQYGSVIQDLSENIFQQWIHYLLSIGTQQTVSIALDLYHFFYARKETRHELPKELTLNLLSNERLFQPIDKRHLNQMDDFNWSEIAKKFIAKYPTESKKLIKIILKHFGEDDTILDSYSSDIYGILAEIVKLYPKEAWGEIVKHIGPPVDSRAFRITHWLHGVLSYIPTEIIWKWVEEDVKKRAWYLATFTPKVFFIDKSKICLARELLVKYGELKDVRNALAANFWSGGFSGPASAHYQKKKDWLVELRKQETDKNVIKWLDEFIASLEKDIEREKADEERRGF